MPATNTLAYLTEVSMAFFGCWSLVDLGDDGVVDHRLGVVDPNDALGSSLNLSPNVIKLLRPKFMNFCNNLVFVLGRPLHLSLMSVGKVGAYRS